MLPTGCARVRSGSGPLRRASMVEAVQSGKHEPSRVARLLSLEQRDSFQFFTRVHLADPAQVQVDGPSERSGSTYPTHIAGGKHGRCDDALANRRPQVLAI